MENTTLLKKIRRLEKKISKEKAYSSGISSPEEEHLFPRGKTVILNLQPDENLSVMTMTPNIFAYFGYNPSDYKKDKLNYYEIIHPGERRNVLEKIYDKISEGASTIEQEYRIAHKKGWYRWVYDYSVIKKSKTGKIQKITAHIQDITEQKHYERMINESENVSRTLLDTISESVMLIDTNGTILNMNNEAAKRIGQNVFDAIGRSIYDFMTKDAAEKRKSKVKELINIRKQQRYLDESDGKYYDTTALPVFDDEGKVSKISIFANNITDLILAENKIRESEERLRTLINAVPDIICFKNGEGRWLEANKAEIELFELQGIDYKGKTNSELTPYSEYYTDALFESFQTDETTWESGNITKNEFVILGKDGNERIFDVAKIPLFNPDKSRRAIVVIGRDITEKKIQDNKLRLSLKEKEVILKEIHHRVKNNLNIILSLLRLQSERIKDKTILSNFRASEDRILSMSLIHELLYGSSDLANINFADYTEKLCQYLLNSYKPNEKNVKINISVKNMKLDIDTAIPCGLILNELISNSLKHAFTGKEDGKIEIIMNKSEDMLSLIVKDNGKGIEKDFDIHKSDSLGMELVEALTQQLNGRIEIIGNCGMEVKLEFPYK